MIWFRKKTPGQRSPHPELREMLLCESSLRALAEAPNDDPDTPLARFHAAQASMQVGDRAHARRHLHELLGLPALAMRWQLQAWACLRELDELPSPATGAAVRGVVVDLGTPRGLETIAVYADGAVTLLRPDGETHSFSLRDGTPTDAVTALLTAAREVVQHTDPHRQPESPPEAGHACIRVLTFAGTHIGLASLPAFERDPVGGPVLRGALALRDALLPAKAQPTG